MDNAYLENMAKIRKVRMQALAILRRAREAGIPSSEMRIDGKTLLTYLDTEYHNGKNPNGMEANALCDHIFNHANELFKYKFIVIDGGNIFSRRKAGFALLFRMIACDFNGKFITCQDLTHKLSSFNSTYELSRNDYADDLKRHDILFIEEFRRELIKTACDTHWFMDEILSDRDLNNKPTIFTFSNPVAGHQFAEQNALSSITDYGQYMCMLSQLDTNRIENALRIRVTNPSERK